MLTCLCVSASRVSVSPFQVSPCRSLSLSLSLSLYSCLYLRVSVSHGTIMVQCVFYFQHNFHNYIILLKRGRAEVNISHLSNLHVSISVSLSHIYPSLCLCISFSLSPSLGPTCLSASRLRVAASHAPHAVLVSLFQPSTTPSIRHPAPLIRLLTPPPRPPPRLRWRRRRRRRRRSERGRPTRARSWWSWRRSSTSTATCAVRAASRWRRCSACPSARSRSGSRTGAWSSRRSRSRRDWAATRRCRSSIRRADTAAAAATATATWRRVATRTTQRGRLPTCRRRRRRRSPPSPASPPSTRTFWASRRPAWPSCERWRRATRSSRPRWDSRRRRWASARRPERGPGVGPTGGREDPRRCWPS